MITKTETLRLQTGEEEAANNEPMQVTLTGSNIDKFIRRCLIAFGQIMFEQFSSLFKAYYFFLRGQPYEYLHSTQQLEDIVSKKIQNFENSSMLGDEEEIRRDMQRFSSDLFTQDRLIGMQTPVDKQSLEEQVERED